METNGTYNNVTTNYGATEPTEKHAVELVTSATDPSKMGKFLFLNLVSPFYIFSL